MLILVFAQVTPSTWTAFHIEKQPVLHTSHQIILSPWSCTQLFCLNWSSVPSENSCTRVSTTHLAVTLYMVYFPPQFQSKSTDARDHLQLLLHIDLFTTHCNMMMPKRCWRIWMTGLGSTVQGKSTGLGFSPSSTTNWLTTLKMPLTSLVINFSSGRWDFTTFEIPGKIFFPVAQKKH